MPGGDEEKPVPGGDELRWARMARIIGPLLSAGLFVFAVLAIRHFLGSHGLDDIAREVEQLPWTALALALILTAVSYFVLTGYDVLALRYIGRDFPYRKIAFTSFICYALSHNIGMSALSGGSARYRLYSSWGVTIFEAARIVVFCNVTFWIGFFTVGGPVMTWSGVPIPAFANLPFSESRTIGLICFAVATALAVVILAGAPYLRIAGRKILLPTPRLYASQMIVGATDWAIAAAVLHAVLPEGAGSYLDTLALFLLAQVVAMASNVPGGMGVFESLILYLAGDRLGVAPLMGSLVIYRVIYYLIPLAAALLLLALSEIHRRLAAMSNPHM